MTEFFTTSQDRRLAYSKLEGASPGVVFLGGFRSDMTGDKAVFLEDWARRSGVGFLRFDYSGHGQSSGDFLEGAIGDWAADAAEMIDARTEGPQILVGSSMGGWIALLVARHLDRLAGLVGIAAAPDFTEDSMWAGFDEVTRARLASDGQVSLPSDYSDEPYIITRRLIEDGRENLVLRAPLRLTCPVRLLQGMADTDVSPDVAMRLAQHLDCPDLVLTMVKHADHRFSSPGDLELIAQAISDVRAAYAAAEAP